MQKRARRMLGLLAVVALVSTAVIAGTSAAATTRTAQVPVLAYRLHATLKPASPTTGVSGRFDALLVRTGLPLPGAAGSGVPSSTLLCPTNPRMGAPCRLEGAPLPHFPVTLTGTRWLLIWRVTVSGATRPTSAEIRVAASGATPATSTPLLGLNRRVTTIGRGWKVTMLPDDVAQGIVSGSGSVVVHTGSGDLSGSIAVSTRLGLSVLKHA